jgi:Tfp pilus assembly protein PilF
MIRLGRLLLAATLAAAILPAQSDLPALRRQAKALVFAEQPSAALEVLGRAREMAPKDPELLIWTGEAWFQLENWERAATAFREAVALDKDLGPHLQNLGHALLKLQRLREAKEQFQLIADKGPSAGAKARGLTGVGLALVEEGDEKLARARFEEALKLDPAQLRARYRLALIQIRADETAAAIENLRVVVEADPLYEGAAYNLALAYRTAKNETAAKDWEESFKQVRKAKRDLEDLKTALRKNPASVETALAIARVYARAGSNADAAEWFTRYLAARPNDVVAQQELERVRKKLGK